MAHNSTNTPFYLFIYTCSEKILAYSDVFSKEKKMFQFFFFFAKRPKIVSENIHYRELSLGYFHRFQNAFRVNCFSEDGKSLSNYSVF